MLFNLINPHTWFWQTHNGLRQCPAKQALVVCYDHVFIPQLPHAIRRSLVTQNHLIYVLEGNENLRCRFCVMYEIRISGMRKWDELVWRSDKP